MHDHPEITPEFKQVNADRITQLPKVALTATGPLQPLIDDNVVYAEIHISSLDIPEPDDRIDARYIISADRSILNAQEVAELARGTIAARNRDPRVVGFALAGEGPVATHANALDLLARRFVPVTISAPGGISTISEAVSNGAQRLTRAVDIYEDFDATVDGITAGAVSSWVRDRGITVELTPNADVAAGVVDDIVDHPLTLLQQMAFTCAINPTEGSTLTDEFVTLADTYGYGYDEFFDLTTAALNSSFARADERREILATRILPTYEKMSGSENDEA